MVDEQQAQEFVMSQIASLSMPTSGELAGDADADNRVGAQDIGFDFSRYPTVLDMALDPAKIKMIIGPAGSAKTTGIIWIMLMLAMLQEPAPDGVRYTMMLVARNTTPMLRASTISSFKKTAGHLLTFKTGTFPMKAFLRCTLNDGTEVHCDFEFVPFDDEQAHNKLLGYEPTIAFVDEVSELPESLVYAIDRRLGRYPAGRLGTPTNVFLFGATNGPLKNHWLYDWYMGKKKPEHDAISREIGRPYVSVYQQPAALIRPRFEGGRWLPNPMAENVENLPGGYAYYYAMLSDEDEKIKAYVEGDFADLRTGKVVFPEFNKDFHVMDENEPLPEGVPLMFSFDFGRTPVCLVGIGNTAGRLIIVDEIMGEDMSIETLWLEHVVPILREKYPRDWVELAWGDPAGEVETQATDLSPYDVLSENGVPIDNPGSNKIGFRIEAVKQYLKKLAGDGKPMLQIRSNCKYTIAAMQTDYVYESVRGKNDVVKDTPTKTHVNWVSDLADALQYMCMGFGKAYRLQRKREQHRMNSGSRRRTRYI